MRFPKKFPGGSDDDPTPTEHKLRINKTPGFEISSYNQIRESMMTQLKTMLPGLDMSSTSTAGNLVEAIAQVMDEQERRLIKLIEDATIVARAPEHELDCPCCRDDFDSYDIEHD